MIRQSASPSFLTKIQILLTFLNIKLKGADNISITTTQAVLRATHPDRPAASLAPTTLIPPMALVATTTLQRPTPTKEVPPPTTEDLRGTWVAPKAAPWLQVTTMPPDTMELHSSPALAAAADGIRISMISRERAAWGTGEVAVTRSRRIIIRVLAASRELAISLAVIPISLTRHRLTTRGRLVETSRIEVVRDRVRGMGRHWCRQGHRAAGEVLPVAPNTLTLISISIHRVKCPMQTINRTKKITDEKTILCLDLHKILSNYFEFFVKK